MIKAFFWSRKWALWAWGGGVLTVALVLAQVRLTLILNGWRKEFYDLLETASEHPEHISQFWALLWKFLYIVMPMIVIAMSASYFSRLYAFRWREAMTFDYAERLRRTKQVIEGESQRVQEDTQRFARIVESVGGQVITAIVTIVAFRPLLWDLSAKVELEAIKGIPGSLFWIALATGVGGTAISWFVGIKLSGLEYNNQVTEAAFRKELVYAEDDKVNFGSVPTLTYLFTGIRFNYHRLFLHYGYFDLWANSYAQIMAVAALIAMGPSLFAGAITLGTLTAVANAFDEVHASFSVFTNNWTTITELRSIWRRLHEFEANLDRHQISSV